MLQAPEPGRDAMTTLDEPHVWQEITRVARAALREAAGDVGAPPMARVRTEGPGGETWEVRAQPLLQANQDQPMVIVAIERVVPVASTASAPAGPSSAEVERIRQRFGLSPRQAEVASLLARRMSDKEIAARLGIAYNTARRHSEIVLMRLRLHDRSDVAELLSEKEAAPLARAAAR